MGYEAIYSGTDVNVLFRCPAKDLFRSPKVLVEIVTARDTSPFVTIGKNREQVAKHHAKRRMLIRSLIFAKTSQEIRHSFDCPRKYPRRKTAEQRQLPEERIMVEHRARNIIARTRHPNA